MIHILVNYDQHVIKNMTVEHPSLFNLILESLKILSIYIVTCQAHPALVKWVQ